jgi:hypothetical protein
LRYNYEERIVPKRKAQDAFSNDELPIESAKVKYHLGQHGAKEREQTRLSESFNFRVHGPTHQSEHPIGFEPLNRTSGLKRGAPGRATSLENIGPAYQEVFTLHRAHIGTGTGKRPGASGFNSQEYRNTQRSLIESEDISSAVQINQLDYAFNKKFRRISTKTIEGRVSNDSFDTMVSNMRIVTYARDTEDVSVAVDATQRAEMYLSRRVALTGSFPSIEEENEARQLFGLPMVDEVDRMEVEASLSDPFAASAPPQPLPEPFAEASAPPQPLPEPFAEASAPPQPLPEPFAEASAPRGSTQFDWPEVPTHTPRAAFPASPSEVVEEAAAFAR